MKKINISKDFLTAVGMLVLSFIIVEGVAIPNTFKVNQQASVVKVKYKQDNIYKITPSKTNPGKYKFNYVIGPENTDTKDEDFDIPIIPFNDAKAQAGMKRKIDFGHIRDAWNYPVQENAYDKLKRVPKAEELPSKTDKKYKEKKEVKGSKESETSSETGGVKSLDADTGNIGVYNCRANTSVTGYFKAYFEDVAVDNNIGYDDPIYGEGRRQVACQVLQDISEMIKLDTTDIVPDIIFKVNPGNLPPNALAAATAYTGYYSIGPDNGSLHHHIISGQDPTPQPGSFDALVITNFNGIPWDVDTTLNPNTYNMYSVLYHETLHALGFRGLLPPIAGSNNAPYDTFDTFSYQNNTLDNPFVNSDTGEINAPNGAPSPWFTSNEVVYQGTRNIVGATPGPIDPIYSPATWQQGSSLSHFDMNRANGEVFIMNPSIPPNTQRNINPDEKEVLCQLGYMVDGLSGCEAPAMFAVDDVITISETNSICVRPIDNDISIGSYSYPRLNSLNVVDLQNGDTIDYYSGDDCDGNPLPNVEYSKSFLFHSVSSPSARVLSYTISASTNNGGFWGNRISNEAKIYFSPSCASLTNDPYEYICNGGFELGPYPGEGTSNLGQVLYTSCPSDFIGWCSFSGSADIADRSHNFQIWGGQVSPYDTHNGEPNNRYSSGYTANNAVESLQNITITPVPPGDYVLSWYSILPQQPYPLSTPRTMNVYLSDSVLESVSSGSGEPILSSGDLAYQIALNESDDDWTYYEMPINIPNNGVNYRYIALSPSGTVGRFFSDDISLRPVGSPPPPPLPTINIINGTTYQDLNNNGTQQSNESSLSGIQVSLFEQGQTTALQTVSSQNIPDLGKYTFNDVPDGSYYIALTSEGLFQNVTEPGIQGGLPGFDHVYPVTVSNGQTINNKDFGVSLVGDTVILGCIDPTATNYNPEANTDDGSCNYPIPGCTEPSALNYNPQATVDDNSCAYENRKVDIKVSKTLEDGTLSFFDRQIKWKVRVTNTSSFNTTNILVKDAMPTDLIYLYSSTNTGTYTVDNNNIGSYNIPYLGANQSVDLYITMKVPRTRKVCGIKTNIAQLVSLDQYDDDNTNNTSFASITLPPCKSVPVILSPRKFEG